MPITEADFRRSILPFTLREEGGLSLDRADAGNWTGGKVGQGRLAGTKYGIAAASHPTLDIRRLTLAQACDIYWAEYCVRPGFDRLSPAVLQVVFDAGVNCGTSRARAWLALGAAQPTEARQIATITAANLAYHRGLATWPRYGKVWGGRIEACRVRALALLAAAPVAVPSATRPPAVDTPRTAPRAAVLPSANPLSRLIRRLAAVFTTGLSP